MPAQMEMTLTVTSEDEGLRLDQFLVQHLPHGSRRLAKRHLERRLVTLTGRPARAGSVLRAGDVVVLHSVLEKPTARPQLARTLGGAKKHLRVLHEDEDLLVVSKRRGMPSVTHEVDDPLTLADCIAEYCPSCADASPDPREAGLVQRLDEYTSGAVIAAKHPAAWERLRAMLFEERVKKSYLAVVEGGFSQARMEVILPLRQSRDGKRMESARSSIARPEFAAKTRIQRLAVWTARGGRAVSLVRCFVARARRHQLRVHLAHAGYPILGDSLYGAKSTSSQAGISGEKGFLLFAESIELVQPFTKIRLKITAQDPTFEKLRRSPRR